MARQMVLSRRGVKAETDDLYFSFDGDKNADVRRFLFTYENVVMREKDDNEKALSIVCFLAKDAFDLYYERFTTNDVLKDEAHDYEVVKAWLLDEYQKKIALEECIQNAVNARLDGENLTESLNYLDRCYQQAGFNEEAKFGLLRQSVKEHVQLADFTLYKGPETYEALKKVIRDYVRGTETYCSTAETTPSTLSQGKKNNQRTISFSNAKPSEDAYMNAKIDSLTSQVAELALVVKKQHSSNPPVSNYPIIEDKDRTCSFCGKKGHSANRCDMNPHRNTRCNYCGKMGHSEATCWSKPKLEQGSRVGRANIESNKPSNGSTPGSSSSQDARKEVVSLVKVVEPLPVSMVKRTSEGEVIKRRKGADGVPIPSVLNPMEHEKSVKTVVEATSKKSAAKSKKPKKKKGKNKRVDIGTYVEQYNVISAIANADSGMKIGQLFRGDAEAAQKVLVKLLNPFNTTALAAAVTDSQPKEVDENTQNFVAPVTEPHARRLKMVDVMVHGNKFQALFDSGAVPNLIETNIVLQMRLGADKTEAQLQLANGSTSGCRGIAHNIPVTMGDITVPLDFLIVDNPPCDILLGSPTLESLHACIDLGSQFVRLTYEGKVTEIPLDYERNKELDYEKTDSEDFTSSSESSEGESDDEELVLAIQDRKGNTVVPEPVNVIRLKEPEEESDRNEERNYIDLSSGYWQVPITQEQLEESTLHLNSTTNWRQECVCFAAHRASECSHMDPRYDNPSHHTNGSITGEESDNEFQPEPDDQNNNNLSEFEESVESNDEEVPDESSSEDNDLDQSAPEEENDDPENDRDSDGGPQANEDVQQTQDESSEHGQQGTQQAPQGDHEESEGEDSGNESPIDVQGFPDSLHPWEATLDRFYDFLQDRTGGTIEDIEVLREKIEHIHEIRQKILVFMMWKTGTIAWKLQDLRPSSVPVKHYFELTDSTPIYHRPRRMSPRHQRVVQEEIQKMLEAGIIKPSAACWSFPVVIAQKKDGKPRFCVDYRELNKVMKADRYPIPNIEEILEELKGHKYFTTLDLFSGYWQIRVAEELKEVTTFTCKLGTFCFEVMPFGLMNAPATFQRMMNEVLKGLSFVRVYLDDVVIFSNTEREHLDHVLTVLERLAEYNLKIKVTKCDFFQEQLELLGHIVSENGIEVDPEKIAKINNVPVPTNRTEVQSFIGLASYYRRFIRNFAKIAAPLHSLTSKKVDFVWTEEAHDAFEKLKSKMCNSPVLAYPDFTKPFIVETDASSVALGAVLSQKSSDGKIHPLQFASRTMNAAERNYSACEREALAVIFALKKFRVYLLSDETFTLITDHQALRYAFKKKDVHGRLARWLDLLAEYRFNIEYRPGKENGAADFLSRNPLHKRPKEPMEEHRSKEIVAAVTYLDFDLEPQLLEIIKYLQDLSAQVDKRIKREAKKYVLWGLHLFRRTANGLRSIPAIYDRIKILRAFHDEIGHWAVNTTKQFILDRFWWPGCQNDIHRHVRTCHECQMAQPLGTYKTTLKVPVTSLFHTFSIDFAGPLPLSTHKNRFLLVAVEHLTNWPIAIPCTNATADVVIDFVKTHIIYTFGPPKRIISDNATCFTATNLKAFMKNEGIDWHTVMAYAPMSNGKAERMIGTIKKSVTKAVKNNPKSWDLVVPSILYGYRRRQGPSGFSPFELMYGAPASMTTPEVHALHEYPSEEVRKLELEAAEAWRASRVLNVPKPKDVGKIKTFKVGDHVLVTHGEATKSTTKWPAFTSKYQNPCVVTVARHPYYELRSSSGKKSRKGIHARRLKLYHKRETNVLPVNVIRLVDGSMATYDYGGIKILRRTMAAWLYTIEPDIRQRQVIIFSLIHICLSFSYAYGPFLTWEKLDMLEKVALRYDYRLRGTSHPFHLLLLHFYHYSHGSYADAVYEHQTYKLDIQTTVGHIRNDSPYVLDIPPITTTSELPFPLISDDTTSMPTSAGPSSEIPTAPPQTVQPPVTSVPAAPSSITPQAGPSNIQATQDRSEHGQGDESQQ